MATYKAVKADFMPYILEHPLPELLMSLASMIAMTSFALTIPQGLVAILQLRDRFNSNAKASSNRPYFQIVLLAIGIVGAATLGVYSNKLAKSTNSYLNCLPVRITGSAGTHARESPAVTGDSNSFNYVGQRPGDHSATDTSK